MSELDERHPDRGMYYNREGKAIDMWEWARLTQLPGYKRIAATTLPDGRWISTVWIGLNHSFTNPTGPFHIFETMVFSADTRTINLGSGPREVHEEEGQWRYNTEAEALAGHEAVVAQLRGPVTINELVGEDTHEDI